MTSTYDLYRRVTALPQGHRLFSIAFSQKAPYYASVRLGDSPGLHRSVSLSSHAEDL